MKTALIKALRRFAGLRPRAGFAVARVLAWLTRPLGRGISEERLAAVLPELDGAGLRAARRRTWSNFLMDEALDAALERRGSQETLPKLVAGPALEELRPPLIIASFHVGPVPALGTVLERLHGEVVVVQRGRFAPRPGLTLVRTGEDEWERARTFHRAVRTLNSGAFVFTTLDGWGDNGYEAATVDAPMLGGTVSLARGGFALARITGTPLVPMVARWHGSGVEVTSGDAILPGPSEEEMAATLASWLGSYLRDFPGEITPRTLAILRTPGQR